MTDRGVNDRGDADSVAALAATNSRWVAGLKTGSAETTAALRARIRDGLGAALAGRADVSDADLDDFTQDAVVRVLERLDTFRGDSRFTTWAMAVAVRISLTALRRRRWAAEPIGEHLDRLAALTAPEGDASAADAKSALLGALRGAIATDLSAKQRQVLLGELAGIPQVVLADQLASTPGAIYKVSHDARRKLRTVLTRAGYDMETVKDALASEG